MKVLSLFDWISCGRVALERANIKISHYYASEIDKFAIQIAKKNHPDTIELWDIQTLDKTNLPKGIDLLIWWSPCQWFSFAWKQLNFKDKRSKLFFEYARILKLIKPKYFIFENVRMKQVYQDVISEYLGVKPIMINSSLLSAQNRVRLYWTNIPNISQPENRNILIQDILEDDNAIHQTKASFTSMIEKKKWTQTLIIPEGTKKWYIEVQPWECFDATFKNSKSRRWRAMLYKSNCLTASSYDFMHYSKKGVIRKLTPIECERLQTLDDNYTLWVSNSQRYKMLGNGWTVDVIAHLLKYIE